MYRKITSNLLYINETLSYSEEVHRKKERKYYFCIQVKALQIVSLKKHIPTRCNQFMLNKQI